MLTSAVVREAAGAYFHFATAAMAAFPSTGLPPSNSAFSTLPVAAMVTFKRPVPTWSPSCCRRIHRAL
jgi:hypothetical protein